MKAQWIHNPYPVWDEIKSFLTDDTGEIEKTGVFVGVFDDELMVGAFLFRPWNEYCYEIHGGVSKEYWGQGAKICDLAGRMFFHSSSCLKLVAVIPAFNLLMRKCVEKCGMKREGVVTKSYLKWSRLHDQIIYAMTKGEMRCLQQL